MPTIPRTDRFRPMNVAVARGSRAEAYFRALAAVPNAEAIEATAIATGLPPTPKHNLRFHGGKIMPNLTFTNFYVGGDQAWQAADMKNIDLTLSAAMADKNLNNVMMQYFKNDTITSVFKPSQVLPGSKPAKFSQGDVENLLTQLQSQGKLAGYDLSATVFNFMLPSGTVLTTDSAPSTGGGAGGTMAQPPINRLTIEEGEEADSLNGLGGYHGSVHINATTTVYYAVGCFSEKMASGQDNGIVAFDQPWKNVVATFYHELNEARTDADVEDAIRAGNDPGAMKFIGWMSDQGEECGDFPVFESGPDLTRVMQEVKLTDGSGTVPVQFQYSNAVKGPEGPIATPHPLPAHYGRMEAPATVPPIHPINS